MKYAYIQNGAVVQVLRVPPETIYPPEYAALFIECGDDVEVGWLVVGGGIVPPASVPDPVPQSITRAQGKAALILAGYWPGVLAYVEAIADDTTRALAEVALHDTLEWQRSSPFLNSAAEGLGLDGPALDALFVEARGIDL